MLRHHQRNSRQSDSHAGPRRQAWGAPSDETLTDSDFRARQRSSPNRKIEIAIIANMKFGIHAATTAGSSPERPSADVIPSAVQYAKPMMIANPKLRPRLRLRGSGSRLSDIPSATIITHASGIAYFKSRSTT